MEDVLLAAAVDVVAVVVVAVVAVAVVVAAAAVVVTTLLHFRGEVFLRLFVRFAFQRKLLLLLPRLLQLSLKQLLLRLKLLLQRDDTLKVRLVLRRHFRHTLGRQVVAFTRHTRHFVIELLGNAMLDAVVLGNDPLVVMLIKASLKRAAEPWLATYGAANAWNEIKEPITEMFFDQMLVQIERSGSHDLDVVTHQALHLLVKRVFGAVDAAVVAAVAVAIVGNQQAGANGRWQRRLQARL